MMLTRRRLLAITGAACLANPASAKTRWMGRAMGAEASIELYGRGADQALKAAHDTIRRMEKLFSLYDPNSALSRLNRDGHLKMPPEFAALMALVNKIHTLTGGLFDPTVQPLWSALANGGDIATARALIGWENVRNDRGSIWFKKEGMALTLNGIAQGFASDRVKDTLAAHGFEDVVVNMGEYVVGDRQAALGIADSSGRLIRTVTLQNEAIATSSPSALQMLGGAHHILNPKDGAPPPIWDTISVKAPTGAMADGLSTALTLADNKALAVGLKDAGAVSGILLQHGTGVVSVL